MLNKITYTVVIFILSISLSWSQSETELFNQANEAYVNEAYDSAFSIYSKIESQDFYSAELYQNMGTAAYKSGDIPNAVYYFEKGLKLSPGNKDLEHNVELANKKIVDKVKSKSKSGFASWLSHLIGNTADYWASWAVILSIAGGVLMIAYLIIKQTLIKKLGLYIGMVFWGVSILFIIFSFVQGQYLDSKEYAIVFAPSVELKNEPSDVSSTAFVLHEGTKVKILDTTDDWLKVAFSDDKVGWISQSDVKVI